MEPDHGGRTSNPRKGKLKMRTRRRALVPAVALLVAACLRPSPVPASAATETSTRHTSHASTSSAGAHKTSAQTVHHPHGSAKAQPGKTTSAAAHDTTPASGKRKGHKTKPHRSTAYTRLAQMQMEPARVESIQQALISAGAYHGSPTGRWDSETRDAMSRYQTENGFGVTGLPDAKSLMKMGLGPHPLPPELNKGPSTAASAAEGAAAIAPVASPATPVKAPADPANPSVAPPSSN